MVIGGAKLLSPATLADLLAIPEEDRRHEIVDGELVEKEAASGKHGRAQGRTVRALGPFDRRGGGPPARPGGWWFATETEIFLDAANMFRPDVAGWRRERLAELPDEVPIRVRPDWIGEVLSSNRRNDLVKKKRAYHRAEIAHYWIVDPAVETLLVYRWEKEGYLEVLTAERGERVRAVPFDALELQVGVLFGDDEED